MRPEEVEPEEKLYECPECLKRVVDPEQPRCTECDVALTNLSKGRDW